MFTNEDRAILALALQGLALRQPQLIPQILALGEKLGVTEPMALNVALTWPDVQTFMPWEVQTLGAYGFALRGTPR